MKMTMPIIIIHLETKGMTMKLVRVISREIMKRDAVAAVTILVMVASTMTEGQEVEAIEMTIDGMEVGRHQARIQETVDQVGKIEVPGAAEKKVEEIRRPLTLYLGHLLRPHRRLPKSLALLHLQSHLICPI